ncbi:cyclic nucleotide-binding domain-containing protein [Leptolyngbya cf. ectocarpi LEGE 11479]|uniref:histidine kinase n=1 Tax=Leptolyngbya cf. ectocarpi LEGE 11479 TaxID=1828722 RepID=A0A928ZTQ9_LEPEC|nr:ATP-binding protein [Leptolyngbya ectocarpi]MBE9066764.1 cyclic nucleotide-binding domain-containing protein [Leptolyngbya cf. ectocarpi LEGE 11479]
MLCAESLLQMPAFQSLPRERLDWICDRTEHIQLTAGEILVKEGDRPLGFFIQLSGQITVSRQSNGSDIPVGRHVSPSFFGEIQVLTEDLVPVTLTADTDVDLYRLNCPDFLDVLHSCREFERDIFRTVGTRLRGLETFIRSREKMAALGTLSAGLAHELNNPAAALVRALKDLQPAMLELQRMNLVYGQRQVDDDHTQEWLDMRDRGFDAVANPDNDPLAQGDREDALTDWLEDYGVDDAWKLSEPLAAGKVEPAQLDKLMDRWRDDHTELRDMGLRWLSLSFEVMGMIQSGLDGADRISTLVQSMKSYSYMDRAAQQQIDIHNGIEDTLRLFAFKLKHGIKVERHYNKDLPEIMAFGSELNQVWTNLIDNAIDALNESSSGDSPKIVIRTCAKNGCLRVEIEDNGPGIPDEIQNRLTEPFFTTKPMGKGSGLGLDVTRRIIENRHQGSLMMESVPGRTCFSVLLPL